jgi:HEAT repeat protein
VATYPPLAAETGEQELANALAVIQSPSVDERRSAFVSLGAIGGDEVVEALLSGLRDPDRLVRIAAVRAFWTLR